MSYVSDLGLSSSALLYFLLLFFFILGLLRDLFAVTDRFKPLFIAFPFNLRIYRTGRREK